MSSKFSWFCISLPIPREEQPEEWTVGRDLYWELTEPEYFGSEPKYFRTKVFCSLNGLNMNP